MLIDHEYLFIINFDKYCVKYNKSNNRSGINQ